MDQDRKVQNSNQFYQFGMTGAPSCYGPCPTNSFAKVSVETTVHQLPQYSPVQPRDRGYWGYHQDDLAGMYEQQKCERKRQSERKESC